MPSSYFGRVESKKGLSMLRHWSSRAVKLALYMTRFTRRRSSRPASNSSRLKIMFKCRKRSDVCNEIQRSKKSNTNKNRSWDVVPLSDRPSGDVAEMIDQKTDDEGETVSCDIERTSCSGPRERLQNHRLQVAGKVWIPDTWGHEDRLKDWADPSVFDIHSNGLVMQSARTALIEDCGRREPAATILST